MIRVFDAYGREMFISKETWRTTVLPGALKKEWSNPDALCALIIQSLRDGFVGDVVDAARQLQRIDPNAERGVTVLANVYLQTKRVNEAGAVLTEFVQKHGETGSVLTNLAKVHSARGETALTDSTLWHALELDPNQDNGLLWFAAIARDRNGEAGWMEALRRAAAFPGSWRAKLWLARDALEKKNTDSATSFYRQVLEQVEPAPADVLMQISGDLGNNGQLPMIITLVAPRFRPADHGLAVGNNLIKAYVDLNRDAEAVQLLHSLYAQKRPDWRPHLEFWERELDNRKQRFGAISPNAKLTLELLPLEGVVWAREKENLLRILPAKSPVSPRIGIVSPSVIFPALQRNDQVTVQRENREGIFSRSVALYLAEQIHLRTNARGVALFTWVAGRSGFALAGQAYSNDSAIKMAGDGVDACRLIVNANIDATQTEWVITLTILRVSDGAAVRTLSATCVPEQCSTALSTLSQGLVDLACREAEAEPEAPPSWYLPPPADRWPQALYARTQTLVVIAAALHKSEGPSLYGDRAIMDGLLSNAVDQSPDPVARLLLVTALSRHRDTGPSIYRDYEERLRSLQREHPIRGVTAIPLQEAIDSLFAQ